MIAGEPLRAPRRLLVLSVVIGACADGAPSARLSVLDARTGDVAWSAGAPGDFVDHPRFLDGQVEVQGRRRCSGEAVELAAFDLSSGAERPALTARLIDADEDLLLRESMDGRTLEAVDHASGTLRWEAELVDPANGRAATAGLAGGAALVSREETVCCATTLAALDRANGSERFRLTLPDAIRALPARAIPADASGFPLVVQGNGGPDAWMTVSAVDGQAIWRVEIPDGERPDPVNPGFPATVHGDTVLVSLLQAVQALDLATGEQRWRVETGVATHSVLLDDVLFVVHPGGGGETTDLVAVDAGTGAARWTTTWSGPGSLVGATDGVVAAVIGAEIRAFGVDDGAPRWQRTLDAAPERIRDLVARDGRFVVTETADLGSCD